jgi:hypothetical protein
MVHNLAVEDTTVRIEECLFKAIDEDAWRRGLYPNLGVDDAITSERNENVSRVRCTTTRVDPNASKEMASRVRKSEDEKRY